MRHLIVGGGPAGLKAAESIHEFDPAASITIFSSEQELPYARSILPMLLSGDEDERSLYFHPAAFFAEKRIELRTGETVEAIDPAARTLATAKGGYAYDKLLIATGGLPALPRTSLLNVGGVFVLRTLADFRSIDAYIRKETVAQAAVVGGGIVGLKVACQLSRRGIDVAIVEQESRLLPRVIDPDSQAPVARLCWKNGFKILLDERFREFLTSGKEKRVSHLVTYSGRSIRCDMAIMCPGVKSNVALAKAIGLKLRKGIVVNSRMGTSAEGIFAAGDAVETINAATGKAEVMPLWENAVQQGRVAGMNMAGGDAEFCGAIWQNSLQLFGLEMVTLGHSHQVQDVPDIKVLMSPGLKKGRGARLVFSGDMLIGATLLGDTRNAGHYKNIIAGRIPAWEFREGLLSEDPGETLFQLMDYKGKAES